MRLRFSCLKSRLRSNDSLIRCHNSRQPSTVEVISHASTSRRAGCKMRRVWQAHRADAIVGGAWDTFSRPMYSASGPSAVDRERSRAKAGTLCLFASFFDLSAERVACLAALTSTVITPERGPWAVGNASLIRLAQAAWSASQVTRGRRLFLEAVSSRSRSEVRCPTCDLCRRSY
jgi:hypothetical protein